MQPTNLNTSPLPYEAGILADSTAKGVRLTTFVVNFPRIVLAEFNTHRVFSRNSASSRAIPVKKRIEAIREDPYVPLVFGKNKRGMQSTEALDKQGQDAAYKAWMDARDDALTHATTLADLGVHKQFANRILEPFAWHTVIVTSTEWDNFWALRNSPDAQPEIAIAAANMENLYKASKPRKLRAGQWHLPLCTEEEILYAHSHDHAPIVARCAARCARVSYETHGKKQDPKADAALYERLVTKGHMSPLEHPAQVGLGREVGKFVGNFRSPWIQFRKTVPGEAVFSGRIEEA